MTQRDKWAKRPAVLRYRDFCDHLRAALGTGLPDTLRLVFTIPFPKSYSKKKREALRGKPHKLKPDIDNLEKSVLDALAKEDSHVWWIDACKVWGDVGSIEISAILSE